MKTAILAAVTLLWGVAAFAQAPGGVAAPAAQEFVNKVAISDLFEIQSSQLAIEPATTRT
jgi:hypothetical protein